MISADQYLIKKEKGLVSIAKIGAAYALVMRKFNPETGEEVAPEIQALEISQLQAQQAQFQSAIDAIGQMISDMEALSN